MSTSLSLPEARYAGSPALRRGRDRRRWGRWLLLAAGLLGGAVVFVLVTGERPGYDAFGWLVWGHQVLHWNLNTDGAPSWKPISFVFTLPFALFGRAQMWLWMITAAAGAFAGCVFAARIAHRLTGPSPGRAYAPYLAGGFAAVAVLGIDTYSHLVLISNADPLIMAFCLAAIDCHLSGRRRLAFVMLLMASLGRPEAWVFTGLYAIWAWRAVPGLRVVAILGLLLIPAFWFVVPAATSHSWFSAGDLALNQHTVIVGNKITGVIGRFDSLNGLPVQLAALAGVGFAIARRDRATLMLAGAVVLWVAIELAFAYHGWSAVPRYMIEPAAVAIIIAGTAVGRLLADARGSALARWGGPIAVVVLAAALAPTVRSRVHETRSNYAVARTHARQVNRLRDVIARIGGPVRVKTCGQPVSLVGFQSTLAWEVDLNVGDVGFHPGRAIGRGQTIVMFKPHRVGWQVRPYNLPASAAASCRALRTNSAMG